MLASFYIQIELYCFRKLTLLVLYGSGLKTRNVSELAFDWLIFASDFECEGRLVLAESRGEPGLESSSHKSWSETGRARFPSINQRPNPTIISSSIIHFRHFLTLLLREPSGHADRG